MDTAGSLDGADEKAGKALLRQRTPSGGFGDNGEDEDEGYGEETKNNKNNKKSKKNKKKNDGLIKAEERKKGKVSLGVWKSFFSYIGRKYTAAFIVLLLVMQITYSGVSWWTAIWVDATKPGKVGKLPHL